jgi:Protein of unknown function (DUF1360)
MPADQRPDRGNQATKLALMGLFLGSLATFSTRALRRGHELQLRPLDLVLLGLSTHRVGHLVAYERVAQPLREPFTETGPDASGAGETVVAEGTGARRALGELLSCPICVGTWAAAGMVYGLYLAPRPTRLFLAIMGATGAAEVVSTFTEALTWIARAARKAAEPARSGAGSSPGRSSHRTPL